MNICEIFKVCTQKVLFIKSYAVSNINFQKYQTKGLDSMSLFECFRLTGPFLNSFIHEVKRKEFQRKSYQK